VSGQSESKEEKSEEVRGGVEEASSTDKRENRSGVVVVRRGQLQRE